MSTTKDPNASKLPEDAPQYFEKVARETVDAINTRDFSIDSPAWSICAPNFMAKRGGMRSNQQERWLSLQGLLNELKELTKRSPEYHLELGECSVHPDATADSALFYIPHAVAGDPPGLAMSVVGVMAFELIEGKWKLVRYWATMGPPGVDAMIQV